MYNTLQTTLKDQILTVQINRPDKLNALNAEVMDELKHVIKEIHSDKEIKAAIITGAGNKAFVAGADISEFQGLSKKEGKELSKKGHKIFNSIEQSSKPIVAAVNGFALGGGCELAMACHFRTASENARFGQPEVNLGLIPGYGGTQRLVQLIGKGRALELLMSGNMIDASTAFQFGLVNHIFPQLELLEKTSAILQNIISKAPLAIQKCIESANQVFVGEGLDYEIEAFGECFNTNDMKEGAAAFLEKRKPVFQGS